MQSRSLAWAQPGSQARSSARLLHSHQSRHASKPVFTCSGAAARRRETAPPRPLATAAQVSGSSGGGAWWPRSPSWPATAAAAAAGDAAGDSDAQAARVRQPRELQRLINSLPYRKLCLWAAVALFLWPLHEFFGVRRWFVDGLQLPCVADAYRLLHRTGAQVAIGSCRIRACTAAAHTGRAARRARSTLQPTTTIQRPHRVSYTYNLKTLRSRWARSSWRS